MGFSDSPARKLARATYVALCGAAVLANGLAPRKRELSVYYGGARSGDVGGPLVKVARLREYFPEVRWGYNLVYVLSNAPYLPAFALEQLNKRNVPIVHNQNGVFYAGWYSGDWRAQNRTMAQPYHAADWVFYQSEFCRRAADHFLGARDKPGEVLYNAVDTKRFTPAEPTRQRSGQAIHLYYRLESTIAGLSLARTAGLDAHLTIAGWIEDDALQNARRLAIDLQVADRITFSGPYTQQQAPAIYRAADAYVMTKHNDPCPNSVIEALASGLPVIYSDTGGTPELVGREAGVALPCAEDWERPHTPSADDVAQGMLRVAANRSAFSEVARRRAVERFDIAHWIARHRVVFEQLRPAR
jgi:glycosyltransferase involved in cell wall biosynthesis